jgi:predicted CoA-substrate-specific enzyme activase
MAWFLGLDIGSVNAHLVLADESGTAVGSCVVPARTEPLQAIATAVTEVLLPLRGDIAVSIAVTGQGRAAFPSSIPHTEVNEVIAAARGAQRLVPQARTVVDLGGQLSKWIRVDASGTVADFATNGLCAAGSGAFLEQQASRLGHTAQSLGELAGNASQGVTVAGRCSVFAKSDMIHHQQKGTPEAAIAYGLCQALARTFHSSVVGGARLEPVTVLVGGGAASAGLVRAMREASGLDQTTGVVPADPLCVSALGAALLCSAKPVPLSTIASLTRGDASAPSRVSVLPRLPSLPPRAEAGVAPSDSEGPVKAYMGIDVGSVSTNVVLWTPDGRLLQQIYLRTRGKPVQALAEGMELVKQAFGRRLEVLGVGTTGSGRHLAAQVLGADVVRNEITAQLVSANHFFPQADTVFEIGGQDSKFIATRRGLLSEFEMNKICAAGTGSFLEEQAQMLGIAIEEDFARLALCGKAPVDLGSRCTVFMDAELRLAQSRGASAEDLCGGLALSVARNYLEKVVARRPVGDYIVFQGGTASNQAVVSALQALTGKTIHVHPHNRVSGAIGTALLVARELSERPAPTRFNGLDACLDVEQSTFECRACDNRCAVSRIKIKSHTVHFGDVCEKWSGRDGQSADPRLGPLDLFAQRAAAVDNLVAACSFQKTHGKPQPRMGIPLASVGLAYAPMLARIAAELGYQPVLGGSSDDSAVQLGARGVPHEMCLPTKIAVGQVRTLLASDPLLRVFAPSITDLLRGPSDDLSATCFYTQQWPHLLAEEEERIFRPMLAIGDGKGGLASSMARLAEAFGVSHAAAARALWLGLKTHKDFENRVRELGQKALESNFDRAVVVLGRPYNLHDPYANLRIAKHLAKAGLLAIPMDMLPLDDIVLEERWRTVCWGFSRQMLKAVLYMQRDPRLFPVAVSSFGCGVDGFVVRHIEELLAGKPHLLLEFDEHRAEAGLVTRIEAFADEIEQHLTLREPRHYRTSTPASNAKPKGRRAFVPYMSVLSHAYAGALRAAHYEAVILPEFTERTLRMGDALSSGRECHPYSVMAGQLAELVESGELRKGDFLLTPSCEVTCLLRQYGDSLRISLERKGLRDIEVFDSISGKFDAVVGKSGMAWFYEGVAAIELLFALAYRVRPYAKDPKEPMRVLASLAREIEETLAAREPISPVLARGSAELWDLLDKGKPGDRPVVGVTGDLYTRIVAESNDFLADRLEELGLEVWMSPYMAASSSFADVVDARRGASRFKLGRAVQKGTTAAVSRRLFAALVRSMAEPTRALVAEPQPEELMRLAARYVDKSSSWLVQSVTGKLADFLTRGASGAVSAAGVNCMIGAAVAGIIPKLRADFDDAPVIALSYGGTGGLSHRIKIETLAEQVRARAARGPAFVSRKVT